MSQFHAPFSNQTLQYRNYIGEYSYDEEGKVYLGSVTKFPEGMGGIIKFMGDTEEEVKKAFLDSVKDFIEVVSDFA